MQRFNVLAAGFMSGSRAAAPPLCATRGLCNDGGSSEYVGRFDGTQSSFASATVAEREEARAAAGTRGKTAVRWSTLSERIEGLAREMYMVAGSVEPYALSQSSAEGAAMRRIREKMASTDWKGLHERGETMFSYGEEMSTDPLEAQFLKMLAFMKQPKRVLEIGMFVGYGAMGIAEGLPADGRVVSLEIDPFLKSWVRDAVADMPESEKHAIIVGPALASMAKLPADEPFDMIFVDANKAEYRGYVELLLKRALLAPGCMIVADNTMYVGYPMLSETYDAQPQRRAFGDAIHDFNQWIREHPQFEQVILPIRDGVSFIRFKG